MTKFRVLPILVAAALITVIPALAAPAGARPSTVTAQDCNASRGGKVKYEDSRRICRSNDPRLDGLPIRG
ncbi:hypothetical protein ACIP5Y_38400 [Nocardia sp. NPDC088792]|uniref:hypothetical protein n=1 Tax=Nocardia sp. NPDC088792 TaxID=3364332 RepID=UPI0037F9169D